MVVAAGAATRAPPWPLSVTDFKALPQVELFPRARRTGERWAATGWVVAVRAPAVRHAPGLSLAFQGTFPEQIALFVDGESAGAASAEAIHEDPSSFLGWLPSSAVYAVGRPGSVLVLGSGGGTEVSSALAHGAGSVTALELVGPLVRLAREVGPAAGGAYSDPRVDVFVRDARAFAGRSDVRFDRVILPPAGVFNATASGILSAGEDFLNTSQAYRAYLELLAPGGILSVTRWLRTPPRDNVKVILTAAQALRDLGVDDVGARLLFVRSWATGTLLVKPEGFTPHEIDQVRSFAGPRFFDVDWPPATPPVTAYNTIDEPVFEAAVRAVAQGPEAAAAFADAFPFDVTPPTDDRPYFGRFLPLRSLLAIARQGPGAWLPVAEWSTLAVAATLVQSALLAVLLMGLPVVVLSRGPGRRDVAVGRVALYFVAIGLGYLFVEIAAIQKLGLLLGHPVYATSTALGALLVFSGVGSALSDRLDGDRAFAACAGVAAAAMVLALLASAAGSAMSLPLAARATLALAPVVVAGLLMGMPFPLGLRRLAFARVGIAWAWAANGVASVVGAALATLVSAQVGTRGLILCGAGCYVLAALVARVGGSVEWAQGPITGVPFVPEGPGSADLP
jgi:spermidine synthase